MISDSVFTTPEFSSLRAQLKGRVLLRADEKYNRFAGAWNLTVHQRPSLIVVPTTSEDIQASVKFANAQGLGIGVMATGHGIGAQCNGGMLINTSAMHGVMIDPIKGEARVSAGTLWKEVIAAADAHGLAGLAGSASHVGVVGYTLGGGFGFLGRKHGLNSASVTRATMVTGDGRHLTLSASENEELFWALKGGGGNFGVVTSLDFRLYPLSSVYGGAVIYPIEYGRQALEVFAEWAKHIPDEITAAIAFMNIPQNPALPEFLRGRSVVVIKGCYCGGQAKHGEALFETIRQIADPIADSFCVMPVTSMDAISKDPVDPTAVLQYGTMLHSLSPTTIDAIISMAGAEAASPLLIVELRTLGGALNDVGDDMQLLGGPDAQFTLNAIGGTATPEMATEVQTYLKDLAKVMQPYGSNEVFLNFLEVDPSPERVRAAYNSNDWERLLMLKRKYDPDNVFRFNRNIPAEN